MRNDRPYLSIIIPVYNAEAFLSGALGELDAYLVNVGRPLELILVDDGSDDASCQIITEFVAKEHPYRVIHLINRENKGKGFSVAYGMLSAKGRYRIFTDCDLAYPPSEIYKIVDSLERGFDMAVACRVDKDSRYTISPSFFRYLYTRHIASRFFNWVLRRVLLPLCRDSQAGLKGFKAEVAEEIFKRQKIHGFSFDVEVLFLADRMGLLVEEIPVDYRYFDEPSTVTFIEDSFCVLRDMIRIKWHGLRRSYNLPSESAKKRNLIVNADDFAISESVSKGIIDAYKNGIVRSTSVMANTAAFEKSLALLKDAPGLDVGIHFSLTFGMPVTAAKEIPTLVDDAGLFYTRPKFLMRWFLGMINLEDVYRELTEQIKTLREKGIGISHIDSHHHIHILPGIRDVVARIAIENGVKFVRAARGYYRGIDISAMLRRWVVSLFAGSYPEYWHRKGLHAVENFAGFELLGTKELFKRWKDLLEGLRPGNTEVMVHPGLLDEDLSDSYKGGRIVELDVIKKFELKDILRRLDIDLVGFKNLS